MSIEYTFTPMTDEQTKEAIDLITKRDWLYKKRADVYAAKVADDKVAEQAAADKLAKYNTTMGEIDAQIKKLSDALPALRSAELASK